MNKFKSFFVVLPILMVSLIVTNGYGSESISKAWDRPYQISEIMGSMVMNLQGQYLGRVQDFVFDPDGRVIFAVIGYWRWNWRIIGENSVAVPFTALTYDHQGKHLLLNMSWEKLQSAPRFSKKELTDRQLLGKVYRYFGQPYLTG